jgi:hypothetical protein
MSKEPKRPTESSTSLGTQPDGERPIAAVLAEFAAPLLSHVDESTTRETLLEGLELLVAVWNAVVVDAWGKGTNHTAELEAAASRGDAPPELSGAIEFFVQRKHELFAADLRAVSDFDLIEDRPGTFSVHASARLPPSDSLP